MNIKKTPANTTRDADHSVNIKKMTEYMEYTTVSHRLLAHSSMGQYRALPLRNHTEYGFLCSDTGDEVKWFYCDGDVKNMEVQDPIDERAQWSLKSESAYKIADLPVGTLTRTKRHFDLQKLLGSPRCESDYKRGNLTAGTLTRTKRCFDLQKLIHCETKLEGHDKNVERKTKNNAKTADTPKENILHDDSEQTEFNISGPKRVNLTFPEQPMLSELESSELDRLLELVEIAKDFLELSESVELPELAEQLEQEEQEELVEIAECLESLGLTNFGELSDFLRSIKLLALAESSEPIGECTRKVE